MTRDEADQEIARLVREERLIDAAELAAAHGDAKRASELFERACAWSRAANEAMRCDDFARAIVLAVQGDDAESAERALAKVGADKVAAERVATTLAHRGAHGWAARLYEVAGNSRDAADAWEHAGEASKAARLLEDANDVVGAARVLEAALRRDPTRYAFAVTLGGLLLRYGKVDAAVRALQRVPHDSDARASALELLAGALDRMGLREASAEAAAELARITSDPNRSQIASKNSPIAKPSAEDTKSSLHESNAPRVVRMRLFGRYEVVRDVAQSPSARVVECIDAVRGDRVAVKIFAAYDTRGSGRDAIARFEREVRVTAAIDHPNVVPLLDFIPEGPAIVLAWMSGGTLETMIASHELSPARAVEIACAVLTALGEAHRLGVLHRDVKPANVLFDSAGVARLGDFGVAHLGDLSTTATAGMIGTLAYMSPEQREGHPATVQSDIYGVGAMLYEMLSGERPNALELPRTRPSGAHRELKAEHDAIALRLIARDPSERPPDAFAARRALTSLTWPLIVEPAAPRPASVRAPQMGEDDRAADRVEHREGSTFDRWTMREFVRVPLNDTTLARASAFARADHPALQTVLRVHRDALEIWFDSPKGHALKSRLTSSQARVLAGAVEALHANGIVHGQIDSAHIFIDSTSRDNVTLLFEATSDPTATIDLDRIAIARLTTQGD